MTFHVGQKVVCVNDDRVAFEVPGFDYDRSDKWDLKKWQVYEVRSVFLDTADNEICIRLVGIKRTICPLLGVECGFVAARFRPVQENGMSILRAIAANPKRELETVE